MDDRIDDSILDSADDRMETHAGDGAGAVPDARVAYDEMRARCPVVEDDGTWVVLGHHEVVAAATDPEAFSSAVTARRAIPNSLDGQEHATYRALIDRYLTPERVAELEPTARTIAADIVDGLPRGSTVRTITQVGTPFAVRTQSAWLGWPAELETVLVEWMRENQAATRSGDRSRTAAVAEQFDEIIRSLLEPRRGVPASDVTAELMAETVHGRGLSDAEIVSILRNWTAGDLGSLATSVGVIVHFLAEHPTEQEALRTQAALGDTSGLEAAIEEILRIDDPFVTNRRRTTQAVELGGQRIGEDERVLLNWTAANRDPRVFDDPDRFDPATNAEANLVFGIGPHVCPGRDLTLMELRVITEALLTSTSRIEPCTERRAVREAHPVGGWAKVPVVLH